MARSRTVSAGLAQRARVIQCIARDEPYSVISHRLEISTTIITRWRKRFEERRLAGLYDVTRLYLSPPEHAGVLCIDEKTAIQALDRRDPVLPLSPGRDERHGFEYVRHGMLSLYAALDVGTGQVEGMTAARHTSQEFVASLDRVVASQSKRREIHLIVDNFSAHKTKASRHGSTVIRGSRCTRRRSVPRGSIKWGCGSPKSSGSALPAAFSPRPLISGGI